DGSLDLLAGTIVLSGQVVFSETVSRAMVQERSKAVDYFWDAKRGRVDLPLTLSGPITAPTPSIDWGTAGGRLARREGEGSGRARDHRIPCRRGRQAADREPWRAASDDRGERREWRQRVEDGDGEPVTVSR